MTSPLIEAIARAICASDDNLPSHWDDYTPSARGAIAALTEAGYAIVRDDDLMMANGALATHGLPPLMALDTKEGE